jgi:hypothetical protein
MISNTASESGFHFLADYMRCQKYFEWRYVHKLVPKYPATALLFGRAIHEVLAWWYQRNNGPYLEGDICIMFKRIMAQYKDEFSEEEWYNEKVIDGTAMLTKFVDTAHYNNWEPLAVEAPFEIMIPTTPSSSAKLTGRLDLVVRDRCSGLIYVVDHKTTGWGIPALCQTLSVSDQATCYLLLWNENHPKEEQASGVIFNILRKCKSVVECMQHLVMKTTDDLDRFKRDAGYILSEIFRKTTTSDQCFPMNTGACYNFNKPCPYLDLCKGMAYQAMIGTSFIVDEETLKEVDE